MKFWIKVKIRKWLLDLLYPSITQCVENRVTRYINLVDEMQHTIQALSDEQQILIQNDHQICKKLFPEEETNNG